MLQCLLELYENDHVRGERGEAGYERRPVQTPVRAQSLRRLEAVPEHAHRELGVAVEAGAVRRHAAVVALERKGSLNTNYTNYGLFTETAAAEGVVLGKREYGITMQAFEIGYPSKPPSSARSSQPDNTQSRAILYTYRYI